MTNQVKGAGQKMGSALKKPMSAGLSAARKSLSGLGGEIKNTIKTAATLGGALAAGSLVKDAVKMQSVYRNISFSLSKIPGAAMDWNDVQTMVEENVERSGRSTEELADAFHEVFKATGDAEFARRAIETIGTAATATGEGVGSLAQASQLLKRKFDIGGQGIEDALTRFVNLTGAGGKSLDELTGRFAVMAGEASGAGLEGADGVSKLLGMLILLDNSIGEKADPGLKNLFQTLKDGTSQLKAIQKEGRVKFEPDTDALDKIKTILSKTKARAAAELKITADARTVFDELAKPFDLAMEEAKSKGMKKADALEFALAAFDANIAKASETTMKWEDIQKKATKRMEEDPSVQLQELIRCARPSHNPR
jgi:hypothetical protein